MTHSLRFQPVSVAEYIILKRLLLLVVELELASSRERLANFRENIKEPTFVHGEVFGNLDTGANLRLYTAASRQGSGVLVATQ